MTEVAASTDLVIPDPRRETVPVGWWDDYARPIIIACSSFEELDEAEATLVAFIGYIEALQGDALEFTKALRMVEARRGELLGPVEPGRRTDLEPLPRAVEVEGVPDASPQTQSRWRKIAENWEALEPKVRAATKTADVSQRKLLREADKEQQAQKRRTRIAAAPAERKPVLFHCSVSELADRVEAESVDVIVTDPPYGREHLGCYEDLSHLAAKILKPGGVCAAMAGQSYLPDVLARLSVALDYHWTIAYLTPGGQAVQAWDRQVNTFWKPVVLFTNGEYVGDWIGDVATSKPNDNDKAHHDWGQSESGMADLLRRLAAPGDLVCDPFVGGGTTAVVAVDLGCLFVGCDADAAMVGRLA